jgi:uncharacterized damage-inducible protein DinB
MSQPQSIRPFYDRWPAYNRRMVEVVRAMSPDELAIRPGPDRWPLWATIAHTAGVRAYWLCGELGEPGIETTPYPDPMDGTLWEDDPDTPRDADELVRALESTWGIVDECLDRWTAEDLAQSFVRRYGNGREVHTRGEIIQRLFSHDAYHCGELSQTLGIHGLPQIDLWQPD